MQRLRFSIFISALLFVVMVTNAAFAQGNDFPTPIGNIPPWGPPPQPGFPPPPGDSNWSSGAVAGSFQTLWGVRKGDTIGFDVVLDGWGLGALYLAPMCSNCTSMRYLPPTDGSASPQEQWWHGQLGTWCLRCGWEAVAGDDDPQIWLDYTSQKDLWFAAHLEWKYTIPRPSFASWFKVLTDPDKQQAGGIANAFSDMGSVWTGASIAFSPYNVKLSAIFAAMGYGADKLASRYSEMQRDPFDWNYCSAVGWDYDWQAHNDLAWTWPYTDNSGTWLPYSIVMMISMGNAAQVAIDRALSAAQVADWGDSSAENCAWERRAEARSYIRTMGYYMWYFRWSIEVTANAYDGVWDSDSLWWYMRSYLEGLGMIASWSESLQ